MIRPMLWFALAAILAMAISFAAALSGCAGQSSDTRALIHAADLAVCRQIGMATPGDGYAKWNAYDDCADKADAKARAR